ncbi:MAG: cation:proton antiporter [Deferribacterales bacterium]
MHSGEAFLLLAFCLGAYFAPFISKRLMIPVAVGEILLGIGLGWFFADVHYSKEIISFLAELGFLVLMYLAGMEIDFENIRTLPKKDLFSYGAVAVLIVAFSLIVSALMGNEPIMAVAYMTVAIGLLFPVLQDTGLISTKEGQALLVIGGIGEVFSLLGLTFAVLYYRYGVTLEAGIHVLKIGAFIFFVYAVTKLLRLMIWWFPKIAVIFTTTGNLSEMGIRANFVNMFVFVAAAAFMNIEPIVGAFIGGMLFSMLFFAKEDIVEIFSGVGNGFLIPVFFIHVGLGFDLDNLKNFSVVSQGFAIAAILLSIRVVSVIPMFFSALPRKIIIVTPFALSFPLTLMVTVATLGRQYEMMSAETSASLIICAVVTAVIYPVLSKAIVRAVYSRESFAD